VSTSTASPARTDDEAGPPEADAPARAAPPVGSRTAGVLLALICGLAAVLYAWGIGASWGNAFYAAAVRAMSHDPTAFLFGSYDAADVVTVDKPPMALWPQVVSVWILGYRPWAILLPQVLEGVAAVVVLHRAVRRWWAAHSPRTAFAAEAVPLLAALVLALSPVTVAIDRDNNPDTFLVLLLVVAAYALTRALPRGSTGWLVLAAVATGCGFVTKMLAAWMIVPALAVAFLLAAPGSWARRAGQVAVAGVALAVSSLWWPAMVSLWPSPKPWIGGSTDGSAWDLIVGYNGLGRVFGQHVGPPRPPAGPAPPPSAVHAGPPPGGGPPGGAFGGADAGPLRMFSPSTGTQISWLLPLVLLVLVLAVVIGVRVLRSGALARPAPGEPASAARQALGGWALWGTWLVVVGAVFSISTGIFHPYYTSELAPAVAALAAVGGGVLGRRYRTGPWWPVLPVAVALTAGWAWVLAGRTPAWNAWFRPTVLALGATAVLVLVLARLLPRAGLRGTAVVLSLVTVLAGPAVWSGSTSFARSTTTTSGVMPTAGPNPMTAMFAEQARDPAAAAVFARLSATVAGRLTPDQARMLDLVRARSVGVPITLAVEGGAITASPYVISSDATIVAMGGFMGTDPAPDVAQLAGWVGSGRVRFVLEAGHGGPAAMRGTGVAGARANWLRAHCVPVDPREWGGPPAPPPDAGGNPFLASFAGSTLYRCGGGS
jgi:4-amino-4-deoxy-L-arabinose transferase-like glycosyltransferase